VRVRTFGIGIIVATVCAAPATAGAAIVVGQSIDRVRLGATEAQVLSVLGAPGYKMGEGASTSWGYPTTLEGRVGFAASHDVSGMWTGSKRQKTDKGIGPGSSLAKTRKVYPKVKCTVGPFGPRSAICALRTRFAGRRVETLFVFYTRTSPMREVDIGFS
jgi:hypothetical protein